MSKTRGGTSAAKKTTKPKPAARSRHKSPKKEAFLAAYAMTGAIASAARVSRCHRSSHFVWLDSDPDYPQRFADAHEEYVDGLIAEATRRACDGTPRMKFHNGKPIIDPRTDKPYVDREYSDSLLMFLIKKERPEYRESHTVALRGELKADLRPVDLSDAQLAAIVAAAIATNAEADATPGEPSEEAPEA